MNVMRNQHALAEIVKQCLEEIVNTVVSDDGITYNSSFDHEGYYKGHDTEVNTEKSDVNVSDYNTDKLSDEDINTDDKYRLNGQKEYSTDYESTKCSTIAEAEKCTYESLVDMVAGNADKSDDLDMRSVEQEEHARESAVDKSPPCVVL